MRGTKNFIKNGIAADCARYKKRAPASKSEHEIQTHFVHNLEKWSDQVITEDFSVHPHAFMGWIILCAILELSAIAFIWISASKNLAAMAAVSVGLSILAILMAWFEFFRYRKFVDFLFPKRTSQNVYAVRNSKNPPKRRIILGGHADATYEFRYIHLAKGKLSMPLIYASLCGMAVVFIASVIVFASSMTGGCGSTLGIILRIATALFIPVFAAMLFFTNWSIVTDGANDNLSACYAIFAIMRHLQENDIRFDETEVCCLISGSEEAGLRGAEAFAKKHKNELTEIETVFIALDTLREREQLMVYTNGMYGTQKGSKRAGELLKKAAAELGVDLKEAPPYPGAMDSDAFSREGLAACGLGAVNHNPKPYYHTRKDTADNIDVDCIQLCSEICLRAINRFDMEGMED